MDSMWLALEQVVLNSAFMLISSEMMLLTYWLKVVSFYPKGPVWWWRSIYRWWLQSSWHPGSGVKSGSWAWGQQHECRRDWRWCWAEQFRYETSAAAFCHSTGLTSGTNLNGFSSHFGHRCCFSHWVPYIGAHCPKHDQPHNELGECLHSYTTDCTGPHPKPLTLPFLLNVAI